MTKIMFLETDDCNR